MNRATKQALADLLAVAIVSVAVAFLLAVAVVSML